MKEADDLENNTQIDGSEKETGGWNELEGQNRKTWRINMSLKRKKM